MCIIIKIIQCILCFVFLNINVEKIFHHSKYFFLTGTLPWSTSPMTSCPPDKWLISAPNSVYHIQPNMQHDVKELKVSSQLSWPFFTEPRCPYESWLLFAGQGGCSVFFLACLEQTQTDYTGLPGMPSTDLQFSLE